MASTNIVVDMSDFDNFLSEMAKAAAQLDDVPDYLWERMQALQDVLYNIPTNEYWISGARLQWEDGTFHVHPSEEALALLATLRALDRCA